MNLDIQDLLIESCKKMEEYAKDCTIDFVSSDRSCDWYHSSWQYLRAVDCVSAPQWHIKFYVKAIKERIKRGRIPKILISGTADYSLLHIIVSELIDSNVGAIIDVLDLCKTPLKICEWYVRKLQSAGYNNVVWVKNKNQFSHTSSRNQIFIHAVKSDITKFNAKSVHEREWEYDVICTDAFLTRFDHKEAGSILEKWASLLAQDGVVITTVRIYENEAETKQSVALVSNNIHKFCNKVLSQYKDPSFKNARERLNIEVEDLRFKAFRYIERMKSNSLGTRDDIRALFENCGFELKTDERDTVNGEIDETWYCRIVARKRSK